MRIIFLLLTLIALVSDLRARDTLRINRVECEAVFLRENLLMFAQRLEISKAEALVRQAARWPNPTLTADQFNLWATHSQTGGKEVVPPVFGNFGRNRQFAVEIEQLIQTAGKRRKLVAAEEVRYAQASAEFDDLLRILKYEFRTTLNELLFYQQMQSEYERQLRALDQLSAAYQRQVREGFMPPAGVVRLQAFRFKVQQEFYQLTQENNQVQAKLKTWMQLESDSHLKLTDTAFVINTAHLSTLSVPQILETAKTYRPDLRWHSLNNSLARRQLSLEKAKKTPDLILKGSYDRNGNAMLNFFGIGVQLDLPVFNRNQANIRRAEIGEMQADALAKVKTAAIEHEIMLAIQNLSASVELANGIGETYETELDNLLTAHTRSFLNRRISMVEFLDFLDAYLENRKMILDTKKKVNNDAELLNHYIGFDLL